MVKNEEVVKIPKKDQNLEKVDKDQMGSTIMNLKEVDYPKKDNLVYIIVGKKVEVKIIIYGEKVYY